MPSFPSYYLNNLERKRQRSRELREGLSANRPRAGDAGDVAHRTGEPPGDRHSARAHADERDGFDLDSEPVVQPPDGHRSARRPVRA